MRWMTVLYDPRCSFCRSAADWLREQPKYVAMELVEADARETALRYPTLFDGAYAGQLTVVADDREVYRGTNAMLLCLWALRGYRHWALRLAAPERIATTERYFEWFSEHRGSLSFLRWFLP